MRKRVVLMLLAACTVSIDAQQRSGGGLATLAISVTDPSGAPLSGVKVIVEGAAARQARTERGRIAIEELPAGAYKLRFELDGFVPLERELTARAGKPTDVKVTLNPAPKPAPPPAPAAAPQRPPVLKVEPAAIDIPTFQEKNYVGRAAGKSSPLTCATGATAVLLQMREPLEQHTHDEADEFVYVMGGEGTGNVAGTDHRLQAGMLLMVPRGVPHSFNVRKGPLVVLSIKAGQPCPN
jgi:mannose-6-phosphate isomerase-like protein (cupin superfamily)